MGNLIFYCRNNWCITLTYCLKPSASRGVNILGGDIGVATFVLQQSICWGPTYAQTSMAMAIFICTAEIPAA